MVIESRKDKGLGDVASVIVQMGHLQVGDYMVAGQEWGRVRALRDAGGEPTDGAGPASVVDVVGFRGHPAAGDELTVVPSERAASAIAAQVAHRRAQATLRYVCVCVCVCV
jgi:translation initiation factor IF-2